MKREWEDAQVKRTDRCRVCHRSGVRIELAHTCGRARDERRLCGSCAGTGRRQTGGPRASKCSRCGGTGWVAYVDPDGVVPLCGPATDSRSCHGRFDAHQLDLLPHLELEEELFAVRTLGGIEAARRHLMGAAWRDAA